MRIGAVLIDIDGVLTVSWRPLPGAVAALRRLRAAGPPLALVTNTTSRPRASIAAALAEAGFPVSAADILTAPAIAAAYLKDHHPGARCLLLNRGQITEDLAGITIVRGDDQAAVDVVLVGGAGPEFSYQALNRAFGHLQAGAALVAMQPGHVLAHQRRPATRHWRVRGGPGTGRRRRSGSGWQARRRVLHRRAGTPGRRRGGHTDGG